MQPAALLGDKHKSPTPAQMSDAKGQMSGFSGFLLFSATFCKSLMEADHSSMTQAAWSLHIRAHIVVLDVENGGGISVLPAPRSPECPKPPAQSSGLPGVTLALGSSCSLPCCSRKGTEKALGSQGGILIQVCTKF